MPTLWYWTACIASLFIFIMLEYLVMVVFRPPYARLDAGKFPGAIHLAISHRRHAVRVALESDTHQLVVLVLLMGDSHLVITDHIRAARLSPFRRTANKVLCFEAFVSQDVRAGDHLDEFICWHSFPELIKECTVVDLSWPKW